MTTTDEVVITYVQAPSEDHVVDKGIDPFIKESVARYKTQLEDIISGKVSTMR